MLPTSKSGVCDTKEYILGQLYSMEAYFHMGPTAKEEQKKSPRSKERGANQVELARNLYLMGIIHRRILEHDFAGGGPSRSDEHEGLRWKQIYGIPFHLFLVLSGQFEERLKAKNKTTHQKKDTPFKLCAVACFRQSRLGGPMHQHREGCGMATTVFRYFFFSFLDWFWDIK
jgi:hypothetical protein